MNAQRCLFLAIVLPGCLVDFKPRGGQSRSFPEFDGGTPFPRGELVFSGTELGVTAALTEAWREIDPSFGRAEHVLMDDLDDDGDLDLIFANGRGLPPHGSAVVWRSDLAQGEGLTFTDVTEGALPSERDPQFGVDDDFLFSPPHLIGPMYRRSEAMPLRFADELEIPASGAHSATVGDVNGDARPDIFVGFSQRPAAIYLSGDRWTTSQSFPEPINAIRAAYLADFDEDGRLDLLTISHSNPEMLWTPYRNEAHLLRGRGDGAFFSTRDTAAFETEALNVGFAAVGDFDGDAHLDVWQLGRRESGVTTPTTNNSIEEMRISWGSGSSLQFERRAVAFPEELAVQEIRGVLAHDVDNDGFMDVVVLTEHIFVLRGASRESAFADVHQALRYAYDVHDVASGDLDLDGDVDIFQCHGATGVPPTCTFVRNETNGTDFIELYLDGGPLNPRSIGARVVIFPAGHVGDFETPGLVRIARQAIASTSQPSASWPIHFGLPDAGDRFDVLAQPPGGAPRIWRGVPRGSRLRLVLH